MLALQSVATITEGYLLFIARITIAVQMQATGNCDDEYRGPVCNLYFIDKVY